jgi:hypothetical protein
MSDSCHKLLHELREIQSDPKATMSQIAAVAQMYQHQRRALWEAYLEEIDRFPREVE